MAISSANITSFVRSIIGEATASYWTDAEITLYVQFAMAKVLGDLMPWLWPTNKSIDNLSLVNGTQDYDTPSDCYKISRIQRAEDGQELDFVEEDEYYKYADWDNGDPVAWTYVVNLVEGTTRTQQIRLLPTPGSTEADYFIVWYMMNMDTLTDFPDPCRALIGAEAAILARTKNEDVTPDLLVLRKQYYEAALMDLTTATMHRVEDFGTYQRERTLV